MQTEILGFYAWAAIHKALKLEEVLSDYDYGNCRAYRYSINKDLAKGLLPKGDSKYAVAMTQLGPITLPFTQVELRAYIDECEGVIAIADRKRKQTLSALTYRGKFDPEDVAIQTMNVAKLLRSRDSQKKSVYRMDYHWEKLVGTITQKEAKTLFDRIVEEYDFPRSRCEYTVEKRFDTKLGHAITLPVDALHPETLFVSIHLEPKIVQGKRRVCLETFLHEVAHLLQRHEYGRCPEAHGPEFVTLLGELLVKYAKDYGNKHVVTRRAFVTECKTRKIEVFARDIEREK